MAARRELVETVGFDEQTFDGFHLYDADFSFRAYLAGHRLAVVNDIPIVHETTGKEDPAWHRNAAAFLEKHASHLLPNPVNPTFQYQMIAAATRDEAKRVMTAQFESAPPATPPRD